MEKAFYDKKAHEVKTMPNTQARREKWKKYYKLILGPPYPPSPDFSHNQCFLTAGWAMRSDNEKLS